MGKFQPGHKFSVGGRKEKPCRDALIMVLKESGEDFPTLRKIMRKVEELALAGEAWAIKEIWDRTDGKVPTEAKIELGPLENMSDEQLRDTLTSIEAYIATCTGSEDASAKSDTTPTRH